MPQESTLSLSEVFVAIEDPRQVGKVEHDLVELLVVAVSAVLAGADTLVEIEAWATENYRGCANIAGFFRAVPAGAATHAAHML
jgi:hypothetical protein